MLRQFHQFLYSWTLEKTGLSSDPKLLSLSGLKGNLPETIKKNTSKPNPELIFGVGWPEKVTELCACNGPKSIRPETELRNSEEITSAWTLKLPIKQWNSPITLGSNHPNCTGNFCGNSKECIHPV